MARQSSWPTPQTWLPQDIGTILATSAVELLVWWLRQAAPDPPSRIAEIMDRVIVSTLLGKESPGS